MAKFIPDTNIEQIEHNSEQLVYEALRGLSAEYTVLHSFPWLRPNRSLKNEPLREGEADFVVIHPRKGLLVIEVKGGYPELRGRTWFRGNSEMKDPFNQAQRNMHALLKEVEEKSNQRLKRNMFTYGYAVIFPHCIYDGDLPFNTDSNIFLDQRSLDNLPFMVEKAWDAWKSEPSNNLNYAQFLNLQNLLMPKLRLIRHIGADIADENKKIIQITRAQQQTLKGLLNYNRVLVEGVAGSGKTLLAIDFAITLSKSKKKVLFLCYNRHLAGWLQEQIKKEENITGNLGDFEVSTFHSFAIKTAHKANVEFETTNNSDEYWEKEVPLILEQALEVLKSRNQEVIFDALIVDEAQDFTEDWWVTVESLTKQGGKGSLYVFLDLNQSLRGKKLLPPLQFDSKFFLTTNCRNTQSIAKSSTSLIDSDIDILPGSPIGQLPLVIKANSRNAVKGIVLEEIRKLTKLGIRFNQIALIGPSNFEKSIFFDNKQDDEIKFVKEASAWRLDEGVLVTTSRSFKGLEADVVIIYDVANYNPMFTEVDLYVAWTRARHRLILVTYDSEIKNIAEKSIKNIANTMSI
jgi:hypothetical protein